MHKSLVYTLLISISLLTKGLTIHASSLPVKLAVSSPLASTCHYAFSFTVSSNNTAVVTNTPPTAALLTLCNGGQMGVSMLMADVPTANLRFIEQINSNGNVAFKGSPVSTQREPIDIGIDYFGKSYGPYTLLNPNVTGTLSETFTPYIDLNNDQQFNPETECLGQPATFNYDISTMSTNHTLKTGIWTDPSVWSCGRVPLISDFVQIKHIVTIPPSYQAMAMQITFDASQQLLFSTGSTIRLSQ